MAKRKEPDDPSTGAVPARKSRSESLTGNWVARGWEVACVRARQRDPARFDALAAALQQEANPVAQARLLAELFAPLDMMTHIAVVHGLRLGTVETHKGSLRLNTDLIQRRLSIAGLKSGEVQEHDFSDRFKEFLTRWHDTPETGPALPPADIIEADGSRMPPEV